MLPTLKPGTSVISFNWYYHIFPLKSDELVVALVNNTMVVKRIKKVGEKDKIWIEGDNKNESTDSREFGWIPKSNLVGKVIRIIE